MGSKGQSTQTTDSTQTYSPNPYIRRAGQQALTMAQNAANTPFTLPQQPVAGLTPDQQQAFQNVRNIYGVSLPYYNQAQQQFQNSATPVSGQDVANFYNPMAGNVLAQMQNIFGQQQRNTTGQLTQAAGGVGADRIAVGQANLANQQGLSAGQTLSNLYQQALQSALQTKGLQQNAGYGFQGLGTTLQNALLQGNQALLGAGSLQQQQQQQELNAPYNLALQKFAYPFQTAQYLAGVTGGLGPAMGGTTQGHSQSTMTPAQPSIFSQIAGLGLTGLGLYNGGAFSGLSSMMGGKGASPNVNMGGAAMAGYGPTGMPWGSFARDGGAVKASRGGYVDLEDIGGSYQEGGSVIDERFPMAGEINAGADFMQNPKGFADLLRADALTRQGVPLTSKAVPTTSFTRANPQGVPTPTANLPTPRPRPAFPTPPDPAVAPPNPWKPPVDPEASNAIATGQGNEIPLRQSDMDMPKEKLPFPGATDMDGGQKFARSPWMALTAAGLGMMGGTSPFAGVNIGRGGLEGLKVIEQQRTNAMKEVTANQAAERLWQQAQQELNKYNRVTGDTQERVGMEREKLAAELWKPTGAFDLEGNAILFNQKTGEVKSARGDSESATPVDPYDWAKNNPHEPRAQMLMADAERYLQTGTLPPNMGRGAQGAVEARRIRAAAAAMAKERGIDVAELPKRWQDFKAEQIAIQRFMSGPTGNTIRSLNVVVDHASTLAKLGEALKNKDIRAFNTMAQAFAAQTGNPAPTNFDMAKQIVGAELIKALGVAGAGTEAERAELGRTISRASSPAQIESAINDVVRPLLGGQLRGLRQQFVAATGRPEERFNGLLFPETREFLEPKKGGSKKKLSPEDEQALKWANENPSDQRALAIKRRLGVE